jgi:hypothetical protein
MNRAASGTRLGSRLALIVGGLALAILCAVVFMGPRQIADLWLLHRLPDAPESERLTIIHDLVARKHKAQTRSWPQRPGQLSGESFLLDHNDPEGRP